MVPKVRVFRPSVDRTLRQVRLIEVPCGMRSSELAARRLGSILHICCALQLLHEPRRRTAEIAINANRATSDGATVRRTRDVIVFRSIETADRLRRRVWHCGVEGLISTSRYSYLRSRP